MEIVLRIVALALVAGAAGRALMLIRLPNGDRAFPQTGRPGARRFAWWYLAMLAGLTAGALTHNYAKGRVASAAPLAWDVILLQAAAAAIGGFIADYMRWILPEQEPKAPPQTDDDF